MKLTWTDLSINQIDAGAVVVGVYEDGSLCGAAGGLNESTRGAITQLVESKDIRGKRNELVALYAPGGMTASQVLTVGLGPRDGVDAGVAFRAAASASRQLAARQRRRVAFYLDDNWTKQVLEGAICGAMVGCHGQDLYRSEKKRLPFEELTWAAGDSDTVAMAGIVGDSVNVARRLVNEPPQEIYPESFASRAAEIAESTGLEADVWERDRLESARCGALLAVARGSDRPPRLVILKHRGPDAGADWLALVGKGVTFDSGGLSIKPSDSMKTMKCDMAGAATVVAAMQAIAMLKLPVNVVGLVGLVENMPGASAYKLGDVLTARNGKTIEVLNTDAEGRLVLADVLSVALDQGAAKIIDLATLTGACVVALGMDVAGVMTNDQSWCDRVLEAARSCGEAAWQLPMFAEYADQIKSEVADIKNIGEGRWAGAITAAKFLEEFVGGKPWVHVDVAGPSFMEKSTPWLDGGATGAFVRTLVEVARSWQP